MEKTIISVVILLVVLSVMGCTTERYAEYMKECPATIDTPSLTNKQEAGSMSQERETYYPSSYKLFFANTDPPSMMKHQGNDHPYPSSYRLFMTYSSPSSTMTKQITSSSSQGKYKTYYYSSAYRRLFAN